MSNLDTKEIEVGHMCEQITLDSAISRKITPQEVYNEIRPFIDSVLEKFNFSSLHIVATKINDGLSVRYNIKKSIFAVQTENEDPPGVRVIFKITSNTRGTRVWVPMDRLKYYDKGNLPLVPTEAKQITWRKIDIMPDCLPDLAESVCHDITDYFLEYPSDFACCSLNEKCSDAGKCLQKNQDMAASCYYKKNIMLGNIFYGNRVKDNLIDNAGNNIGRAFTVRNKELSVGKKVRKKNELRPLKGKSLCIFPPDFTVIDIETTGLVPAIDQIIEVSAIRVREYHPTETFSSLINPHRKIGKFIENLTGITNEMLSSAPESDGVLPKFSDFIGDDILVGHNANFDINPLYDNLADIRPLRNDFVDTLRIARKDLDLYRYRLCDIAEHFGIEQEASHRALADCETTLACYNALKNIADDIY